MTPVLDGSLVRIFERGGEGTPRVAGAGFLVAPRTICTCAHVVASALGTSAEGAAPEALVRLDFAQIAPGVEMDARITAWRPLAADGSGDVAFLTLESDPPPLARIATLVDAPELWRHPFAVAGFPDGHEHAVWATGIMQGAHGPHLVQLEGTRATGYRVKEGFSGSPVWDERLEGVVGILAEVDVTPEPRAGFMIPARVLLDVHPALEALVRRPRYTAGSGTRDGVPDAPPHFVARPAAIDGVRSALLSMVDGGERVLGIHGMPGSGKSVIGGAIARDGAVRAAFPGGVHWIPVGRNAPLLPLQSELLTMLGETSGDVLDVAEAAGRLGRVLAGRRALVILDDVWTPDQVRAFGKPGRAGALLLTTRSRGLLATLGAGAVEIGALDPASEAMPLLAAWAGLPVAALPPEAGEIARRCGHLPLALAMVGATVRDRPGRWATLRERLANADLAALARQFPEYEYPSVVAAIDASVEALRADTARRLLDLAVFPEDVTIPERALRTLWAAEGLDRWEVQSTVDELADASLALVDESGVRLHDLMADYVRTRVTPKALPALHARLLGAYRAQCSDGWTTAPDDGYFTRHLAHHLLAAGRREELHALLDEETAGGGNRWFEAREGMDDVSGYASDVERAWRDAERGFLDGTLDARAAVGREVRCALIRSSLHAVAEGIPEELLVAVAREKIWSVARSLSFARRTPDAAQRASTIGALLPLASPAERSDVLPDARAALRVAAGSSATAEYRAAFARLVRGVATFDATEALRIVRWELSALQRSDAEEAPVALAHVAAEAPNPLQQQLVDELATRLEALDEDDERSAGIIARCLSVLPAGSLGERHRPLIALAKARAYTLRRHAQVFSQWLLAIAPHLEGTERDETLDDALATLDGASGAWADDFPDFARRLGPESVPLLWDAAGRLRLDFSTVIARARLVPFLPAGEAVAAAAGALAALERVRGESFDTTTQGYLDVEACALARYASSKVRGELAARASAIADAERRAAALASLADAAPVSERTELARAAIEAVATLGTAQARRAAMAAIAPSLPHGLLPAALRVSRDTHDALDRLRLLPAIVAEAPAADRRRIVRWVLRAARGQLEEWDAAHALLQLQPDLPAELIPDALATARQLQSARFRAEGLAAVAPVLGAEEARTVLEEARAAARSGDTPLERAHALAAVLGATPHAHRAAHLPEVLAAAAAVTELEARAEVLARVAPTLPEEKRDAVLAAALRRAWTARRREVVVAELAPHLSLALAREAAEAVQSMDDVAAGACAPDVAARLASLGEAGEALDLAHPDGRGSDAPIDAVLSRVAPHAGAAEVARIRRDAASLDPFARDAVLAALAPRMAELGTMREALAATEGMQPGPPLARALAGMAPHAPPDDRPELLRRAMQTLAATNLRSVSLVTLRLLSDGVASLPRLDAHALLGEWLHAHASSQRAGFYVAVNAMARPLVALGGAAAAADAWDSMELVSRWWP